MKIGFIGVGKLGKEAAEVMAEKHDIVGYDVSNIEPENFKMVASIEEACKGRRRINRDNRWHRREKRRRVRC